MELTVALLMDYYDQSAPKPHLRKRSSARERIVKRRSGSANLLVQGCLALFTMCAVGGVFFALVLAPVLFRLLPYDDQGRVVRRISFLDSWMFTETPAPTRLSEFLPTVGATRAFDDSLLTDPTPTIAPTLFITPTVLIQPTPINTNRPGVRATNTVRVPPTLTPLPPAPTEEPTPQAVAIAPTPAAVAATIPLPASYRLTRYSWVPQKWNNCGPANLSQVMGTLGVSVTQDQAAGWLKPNKDDANVSPWQIVTYTNKYTKLRAISRMNGSLDLVKTLLVAKFGVIIETGLYAPKDKSWEGHYVTPIGYDDSLGVLFNLDTLLGAGKDNLGIREEYTDLDQRWGHFNRVYIVIYPPNREDELRALLGPDADPTLNAQRALARARADAKANPDDSYAWFNMGSSYVLLRDYRQAAAAYDRARNAGLPWRMNWYQFGMISAYYHVKDYVAALGQIEVTLKTQQNVEELFYWRGLIAAAQGSSEFAKSEIQKAITLNPNYTPAKEALAALNNGQTPPVFDTP
jgi:hypothetical protein